MVYEYKSQDSSYVRLLLIQLKHTHECLLWYLYIAHLTHSLLSFLLLLKQLLLT